MRAGCAAWAPRLIRRQPFSQCSSSLLWEGSYLGEAFDVSFHKACPDCLLPCLGLTEELLSSRHLLCVRDCAAVMLWLQSVAWCVLCCLCDGGQTCVCSTTVCLWRLPIYWDKDRTSVSFARLIASCYRRELMEIYCKVNKQTGDDHYN